MYLSPTNTYNVCIWIPAAISLRSMILKKLFLNFLLNMFVDRRLNAQMRNSYVFCAITVLWPNLHMSFDQRSIGLCDWLWIKSTQKVQYSNRRLCVLKGTNLAYLDLTITNPKFTLILVISRSPFILKTSCDHHTHNVNDTYFAWNWLCSLKYSIMKKSSKFEKYKMQMLEVYKKKKEEENYCFSFFIVVHPRLYLIHIINFQQKHICFTTIIILIFIVCSSIFSVNRKKETLNKTSIVFLTLYI